MLAFCVCRTTQCTAAEEEDEEQTCGSSVKRMRSILIGALAKYQQTVEVAQQWMTGGQPHQRGAKHRQAALPQLPNALLSQQAQQAKGVEQNLQADQAGPSGLHSLVSCNLHTRSNRRKRSFRQSTLCTTLLWTAPAEQWSGEQEEAQGGPSRGRDWLHWRAPHQHTSHKAVAPVTSAAAALYHELSLLDTESWCEHSPPHAIPSRHHTLLVGVPCHACTTFPCLCTSHAY